MRDEKESVEGDVLNMNMKMNMKMKSFTVISKCGHAPNVQSLKDMAMSSTWSLTRSSLSNNNNSSNSSNNSNNNSVNSVNNIVDVDVDVRVIELPNVGRCDHSYAYWIQQLMATKTKTTTMTTTTMTATTTNTTTNNNKTTTIWTRKGHGNVSLQEEEEMVVVVDPNIDTFDNGHDNDHGNDGDGDGENYDYYYYDDNDLVMFMKGNDNAYRANQTWDELYTFPEIVQRHDKTKKEMLTCGSRPNFNPSRKKTERGRKIRRQGEKSNIADIETLLRFRMDEYRRVSESESESISNNKVEFMAQHRPLGRWLESVGVLAAEQFLELEKRARKTLQKTGGGRGNNTTTVTGPFDLDNTYVPICYGGMFLSSIRSIVDSPVQDWAPIVDSLSRGDNIEEGHYMERSWAALLSRPFTQKEKDGITSRLTRVIKKTSFSGLVVLKKKTPGMVKKKT